MNDEIARAHIAECRERIKTFREAIAQIDAGWRHFGRKPGGTDMVDVTDDYRAQTLRSIELMEETIRLWQRPRPV